MQNVLPWFATAMQLIEGYAAARAAGASSGDANRAALQAALAVATHLLEHPLHQTVPAPVRPGEPV